MKVFLSLLVAAVAAASSGDSASSNVGHGADIDAQMQELKGSLEYLESMLSDSAVREDATLMNKAAKIYRRAKMLVHAANREAIHTNSAKHPEIDHTLLRGNSFGTIVEDQAEEHLSYMIAQEEDVGRSLYEVTITFPECRELYLEECIHIITDQLASLNMNASIVVHEKRNLDTTGYNRVVIITDRTASLVRGKSNDGIVTYPFMWDDAYTGLHMLGVDGKWDCKNLTPEECCNRVKESSPNPDTKGNYIECHMFVPFGGVGNPKKNDKVIVNLSQDGRVHESPVIV